MRNRSSKLDVSHTLTADAGLGYLNSAAITDHTFITDLLILSAMAFPVLTRSENALAEQSVLLWL